MPLPFQKRGKSLAQPTVMLSETIHDRSLLLVRLLGYGFLLFALMDYAYILIPPQFTNAEWELRAIGELVERVAIPLLAFALVFYRQEGAIHRTELKALRILSWVTLGLSVLYLLLIPLCVVDTWRLYSRSNARLLSDVSRQTAQIDQITTGLEQAQTDQQIQNILQSLSRQHPIPKLPDPQATKKQVLEQLNQAETLIQKQASGVLQERRQLLFKNGVKWGLGAFMASVLFFLFWRLTRWTRLQSRSL